MKYEATYWSGKGKYKKLYDELRKELVPAEGKADTDAGEILRIVGNLYYDIFNNGGCNFGNYYSDRVWLLGYVPLYARGATRSFTAKPADELSDDYMRFVDRFMNWAILYADVVNSMDKLEKELE